jgi:hypothetical protein
MEASERKALAAKLHRANSLVNQSRLANDGFQRSEIAGDASKLIKEVIESLMDSSGMTDYYGNPTERDDGTR